MLLNKFAFPGKNIVWQDQGQTKHGKTNKIVLLTRETNKIVLLTRECIRLILAKNLIIVEQLINKITEKFRKTVETCRSGFD